jgi:hypothetical protein
LQDGKLFFDGDAFIGQDVIEFLVQLFAKVRVGVAGDVQRAAAALGQMIEIGLGKRDVGAAVERGLVVALMPDVEIDLAGVVEAEHGQRDAHHFAGRRRRRCGGRGCGVRGHDDSRPAKPCSDAEA